MKGDEGFTRPRCEGEQNTLFVCGDGTQSSVDGDLLIVAGGFGAAEFFKGDLVEFVLPIGLRGVGLRPECLWRGVGADDLLFSRAHVDLVDLFSVGRVGEGDVEFVGVVFCLSDAFTGGDGIAFGFDDGEFAVFVGQDVVGIKRTGFPAAALHFARRDAVFPLNFAFRDIAPAALTQGGVNQFGSGLGFVHGLHPLIFHISVLLIRLWEYISFFAFLRYIKAPLSYRTSPQMPKAWNFGGTLHLAKFTATLSQLETNISFTLQIRQLYRRTRALWVFGGQGGGAAKILKLPSKRPLQQTLLQLIHNSDLPLVNRFKFFSFF